jgi:hypothetical protein
LLRSTAELQAIGRAFRNCVALPQWQAGQHHLRLIDGSGVYLASDVPPLLVALRRVHGSLWIMEQIAGPKNSPPSPGAREALVQKLDAAGLRILAADPASALSRLAPSTRRLPRFLEPDGADDEEGEEDGELAA